MRVPDVPQADHSLVISQPMLFPWVGMLEQIRLSDTYVFYDDVQFSTGPANRVSRVQVKTRDGMRWMTVPLRGRHLGSLIGGLELDDRTDWRGKGRDLLRHAYAGAPYVQDMLALVDEVFSAPARYLSELSRASTMALARYFGLDAGRSFLDSSALGVAGHSSQRVFALCQRLGATRYVTGHGAKHYLDHELFERAGVAVEYMDYRLSPYSQRHGEFTPYVTGLDLVANCGRDGVRHICSGTISWRSVCASGAAA
ncbi:WbqC family protein [Cupriavidus lacunae]|uniref:WbqC family protein n=1 Tax=Cupriavidus lacunae TaxID=2666307 RepID=A0A370NN39_9BURK|nr:WbqC family protein [Cupriavidus lacunae]RDK07024.1 hypothetical protein DN412_28100 [Cupriavidus lacunae]